MAWIQRKFHRAAVLHVLSERTFRTQQPNGPADGSDILNELNAGLAVKTQGMIAAARLSQKTMVGTLGLAFRLALDLHKTPRTETDVRIALRGLYERGLVEPLKRQSSDVPRNLIDLQNTRWTLTAEGCALGAR